MSVTGNFKQGIDKQGRLNTSVANITSAELLDLLRSTDYTAVQNQKDAVSDADLCRLLDRSDLYDILKQQRAGGEMLLACYCFCRKYLKAKK